MARACPNSNGTSVGKLSKFNLLRGRCTLLLSLFRFSRHYALLTMYIYMYMYACMCIYNNISVSCECFSAWLLPCLVKLNAGRVVTGILRGFDPYMNIVLDDTVEEKSNSQKIDIGMVVCACAFTPTYMYMYIHRVLPR